MMNRKRAVTSLAALTVLSIGCSAATDAAPERVGMSEGHWDTESATDPRQSTHMWLVESGLQLLSSHLAGGNADELALLARLEDKDGVGGAGECGAEWRRGLNDADFKAEFNNGKFDTWPGANEAILVASLANWKSHFYDPTTGLNYKGEASPTAYTQTMKLYGDALQQVTKDRALTQPACYMLGVALHYLTDISQPMHAANFTAVSVPLKLHSHYESWAMSKVQPATRAPTWRDVGGAGPDALVRLLALESHDRYTRLRAQHDDIVARASWTSACYNQKIDGLVGVDIESCWDQSVEMEETTKEAFAAGAQFSALYLEQWIHEAAAKIGHCAFPSSSSSSSLLSLGAPGCGTDTTVTSCKEVRAERPGSADGEYDLTVGLKTLRVYCHDMAGNPREYLTLPHSKNQGEDANYSAYGAGGNTTPGGLKTWYTKVRFLPDTMALDLKDHTFVVNDGGRISFGSTTFDTLDFASAGDCVGGGAQTGRANIDLRGLPLRVIEGQFVADGYIPAGTDTYASDDQIANLTGGGYCGGMSTPSGRLQLSWLDSVFAGHARVALTSNAYQGHSLGVFGNTVQDQTGLAYFDINPVSPGDPQKGYRLAINGQFISTQTTQLPFRNTTLLTTGSADQAAVFAPIPTGDGGFYLRLMGSNDVLTLDTRGGVAQIEPLQASDGFPYFQHFAGGSTFQDSSAVTIYSDAYYSGLSQTLTPGRYDIDTFYSGIGNDKLSSIRVPAGTIVKLYEHAGFQGAVRQLTSDSDFIADFNDTTSSIEILSSASTGAPVVVTQ